MCVTSSSSSFENMPLFHRLRHSSLGRILLPCSAPKPPSDFEKYLNLLGLSEPKSDFLDAFLNCEKILKFARYFFHGDNLKISAVPHSKFSYVTTYALFLRIWSCNHQKKHIFNSLCLVYCLLHSV